MNQKLKGFLAGAGIGTALCGVFAYANRDRFFKPQPHAVRVLAIMNCENTTRRYGELLMQEPGPDVLRFYFRREADVTGTAIKPVEARAAVVGHMTLDDAARIVAPFCNDENVLQEDTVATTDRAFSLH